MSRGAAGRGRSQAERTRAERAGRRAETLAAWYLRLAGWRILARRVKTAGGEIDIVARRGARVSFVEVKWRRTDAGRDAAIDSRRLQRVARAATMLAPRFAGPADTICIDVILMAPGRWPRRIANAWQPGI